MYMKKTISKNQKLPEKSKYLKEPISLSEAEALNYTKGFLLDCIARMYLIATAHSKFLDAELPLFPSDLSKKAGEFKRRKWDLYARNKIRNSFLKQSGEKEEQLIKGKNIKLLFDACFKLDEEILSPDKIKNIKNKYPGKIINVEISTGSGPFQMSMHHVGFLESPKSLAFEDVFVDEAVLREINKPNFYIDPVSFIIQLGDEVYDLEKMQTSFQIIWQIHEQTKSNRGVLIKKSDLFKLVGAKGDYAENSFQKAFPKELHPLISRIVVSTKGGYRLQYYNSF